MSNEQRIMAKIEYEELLRSGMFYEFFVRGTGVWNTDKDEWFAYYEREILSKRRPVAHVCSEHLMLYDKDHWIDWDNDFAMDIHLYTLTELLCPMCTHGKQLSLNL
jgi:hypothetical protein